MTSTGPFQPKLFCEFMSQVNNMFSLVDSMTCDLCTLRHSFSEVSVERKWDGGEASLAPSFCYSDLLGSC